jgi:hypothetical protein
MRIISKERTHLVILLTILVLCACASGQNAATPQEKKEEASSATFQSVQQAKPLKVHFSNILFKEIKTTDVIKKDYPEALADFETSVIAHLRSKKAYSRVEHSSGNTPTDKSLLVGLTISDMRIASFGARFWGGPLAGNSFMNIELELADAASGKTLRTETISSGNSSMAASWNFGASDRSLPSDMGIIVAEYIYTVVPAEK